MEKHHRISLGLTGIEEANRKNKGIILAGEFQSAGKRNNDWG